MQQNVTLDASLFTIGSVNLTGGTGNNTLLGGTGNDLLDGGTGNDHMEGGLGSDKYIVDSVNDQVIETSPQGGTVDTVVASVSFTLGDNLEILELTGSSDLNGTGNSQGNIISGNAGNNILSGGASNDALIGNGGNDVLDGGSGNDTLTGGMGSDRFVYSTGVAFKRTDIGSDTIRDFNPGDAIVLNPLTFNTLKSGVGIGLSDASDFAVVTKDSAAATSSAKLVYNSSNGHLFYNPNGTAAGFGSGGQFVTLENKPTLATSDFTLSISTVLPQSSSVKPILSGSGRADVLTGTDTSGILRGFAGDDKLIGNGGDDEIYGGSGKDIFKAGAGADYVEGNKGNDRIDLGSDLDVDTVAYRKGDGKDIIRNFHAGVGGDKLQVEGINSVDVVRKGSSTYLHVSDGIAGNKGFGSGQLLIELRGTTSFTADTIGQNLAAGNQAQFLLG